MRKGTKPKIGFKSVAFIFAVIVMLIAAPQMVETVEKGTYQVKQAAVTGTMDAKMTPGIWMQNFGDIDVWPKAETFFFTADKDTEDDVATDLSVEVRFNDGSMAKISGTARVIMPTTKSEAIALTTERGHKTYKDVQQKLILPTIRNVLRSTANLMSARESYNEKRLDFISWSRDQITNGVYKTKEEVKEVEDLVTGEKTWKAIKVIRTDGDGGPPLYEPNPMADTGIVLKNFEIKAFNYEKKVRDQIAKQQEARMNVETAKAKAEEARQEELRTVAEGKQKVAAAKYEEEQAKVRAVVAAEKEKEVAEIAAARKVEVAKQAKLEAEQFKLKAGEIKQANILEGEGIAEKNRLILESDGALDKKLKAIVQMNADAMDALARRPVPHNYFAAGSNGESGAGGYDEEMIRNLRLMNLRILDGANIDMGIKGKK